MNELYIIATFASIFCEYYGIVMGILSVINLIQGYGNDSPQKLLLSRKQLFIALGCLIFSATYIPLTGYVEQIVYAFFNGIIK